MKKGEGENKATVVNIRKESYNILISRPSIFGNPFKIGVHGNRKEVIERFKEYFKDRLANDDNFKKMVLALKGEILGCYCKPLPCHGDVIAEYLNNIKET